MTNAEKIRGLTTKALAAFLLREYPADTDNAGILGDIDDSTFEKTCKRCPLDGLCNAPENLEELAAWLDQEAETV